MNPMNIVAGVSAGYPYTKLAYFIRLMKNFNIETITKLYNKIE
jgi:hypothetical protein